MLIRNSLWNASGSALPALAALASVPLLISTLGVEGYGIVTIVSSVIGYFAVLDINLSAGAIKYLAESHEENDHIRFSETFWFGALFYGLLGFIGSVAIFFGSPAIVRELFDMSATVRDNTILALRVGAIGFGMAQVQSYLIVVPQALQRYDRSAQSEAFFGVLVNIISVLAALAGAGVVGVIAVRVLVSAVNVAYLCYLIRGMELSLSFRFPRKDVRIALTSFSAYAYLSKLASTLHQHGDKLIIGALAGPSALTFYTVPVTLSSRILGLTYRLSSVIYPRASALAASARMNELRQIYLSAMRYITYINLVALGMIVLAGEEFLRRWVGDAFVTKGYPILVLMTVALLVDSLTNIPSLVNDALGHPNISGRFALLRGIIGVGLVYIGTLTYGIVGAAISHLIGACILSACFLIYVHGRTVPIRLIDAMKDGAGRSLIVGLFVFGLLFPIKWWLPTGLYQTALIMILGLITLTIAGFVFIVSVNERAEFFAFTRRLRS